VLTDKHIYGDLESDVIELLKVYNTTSHPFGGSEADGTVRIKINNNPDVVHALQRMGYQDLIWGQHPDYAYILEKGKCIVFVTKYIEAHHYFG
jgi:hypothetical protein